MEGLLGRERKESKTATYREADKTDDEVQSEKEGEKYIRLSEAKGTFS